MDLHHQCDGGCQEWRCLYCSYGMPSLTIGLRPHTWADGGFILPPDRVQPTWEENEPAALELIRQGLDT